MLFYLDNGYLYLTAFITLAHIRDSLCAIFYTIWTIKNMICLKYLITPKMNFTIVGFIPCYSEYIKDIITTIDSMLNQQDISDCKLFYVIIVDGVKIGKENDDHLVNEFKKYFNILEHYEIDYKTWKQTTMKVNIILCDFKNHFIILLGKQENMGKKCSLIMGEELLYDLFNDIKYLDISYIKQKILHQLQNYNIDSLHFIYHTDADTKVHEKCFYYLLLEILTRQADACCGFVKVDFNNSKKYLNFWNNLQYCQYFGDQLLKRRVEGIFGNVTCLPGCNTMLNAKSHILDKVIDDYSQLPDTTRLLQLVSRMQGTDRFYTQKMLKNKGKLVMADRAYIYTETPQDAKTFISQRKRWNSNALSNALICIKSSKTSLFNKLNAIIDVIRLYFTLFRLGSVIGFYMQIYKMDMLQLILFLLFVAPSQLYIITHYIFWEDEFKIQLFLGFMLNKLATPFLSTFITIKLMLGLTDFSWGETIKLKEEIEEGIEEDKDLQISENL